MNTKIYLKSPCCNSHIRAEVTQSCRVDVDQNGYFDNMMDFSDPEVNKEYIWCEECGEELATSYQGEGKPYAIKLKSCKSCKGNNPEGCSYC